MSSKPSDSIPLIKAYQPEKIIFYSEKESFSQQRFLLDALHCAAHLKELGAASLINICPHRYYFAVIFAAGLINKLQNLLPQGKQSGHIQQLKQTYSNTYSIGFAEDNVDIDIIDVLEKNRLDANRAQLPLIDANTLAALAFTSGSTGTPKANKKYWRTLVGTTHKLAKRFFADWPVQQAPAIVATVPSQHMYGLEMTVMMALQGECSVNIDKPFYPEDIIKAIEQVPEPCALITTPAHLKSMLHIENCPDKISRIVSATAPLDLSIAEQAEQKLLCPVHEIYGCTEAGSMATRVTCEGDSWHLLEGFTLSGESDAVIASGDHLFEEAPLQDVIDILDHEHFRLLGRSADLINVGGKRSSLGYLTGVLNGIRGVKESWVFLPENKEKKSTQRPAAFVISDRPVRDLLKEMSESVDPVFIPRPVYKITELVRNETGKVTRDGIAKMLEQVNLEVENE